MTAFDDAVELEAAILANGGDGLDIESAQADRVFVLPNGHREGIDSGGDSPLQLRLRHGFVCALPRRSVGCVAMVSWPNAYR